MTFSIIFLCSCQKDEGYIVTEDNTSFETAIRNSSNCDNLLENGDFESYSQIFPNDVDNCRNTIHMGGVDYWTNALGSPDHFPHLDPLNGDCESCLSNAYVYMVAGSNGYVEGIMTDVTLSDDSDIIYTLEAAANGSVNFYLTNGFVGAGSNPPNGNINPDMNLVDNKHIGFYIAGDVDFCNASTNILVDFTISKVYNQLVIFPDIDTVRQCRLDDVSITCRTENLRGINYVNSDDNCTFNFTPNWLIPHNYTSLKWDFGDGNGSSDESPTHSYASTGTYKVILTIEDVRGCCTTVSQQVECDNIVKDNCKNYLCWEQFIGHIECVTSFTYILPDGTTGEKEIGPFGYGNVALQVKNAIISELNDIGYPISIKAQDQDQVNPVDYSKAGYPDRGWFVYSDVIITGLGGNNQGNGSTCVSDDQDSYVFFNYNTSSNCP